jgi:hypothetical protein
VIKFAAASGLSVQGKPNTGQATKVQEVDASSLFSQSTMRSRRAEQTRRTLMIPQKRLIGPHVRLKLKQYLVYQKAFPLILKQNLNK